MTWLYLLAAIALFIAPLTTPLPTGTAVEGLIQALTSQTQVPNLVSGVILHTRLLTIGPDGVMTGDIRARRIVVDGR